MNDETANQDPNVTQAFSTRAGNESDGGKPLSGVGAGSSDGSGRLEVRCPSCHTPTVVAADTSLTDLTCSGCGSHFSLVEQRETTRIAPPLSTMGRFELIERLGVGGFGSVWKARDKELDRTVAIKIPRASGMTAEEQEKFFREARAAAQLRHQAIVSVHEVGRDGDTVYIVSDFVRGVTLSDWSTGQQLTNREAAELCAKIADALHHAHEQGVVHRDLKPANIMMDYDGEPHLMDFGLARRESGEVTVTVDGQVLGTPAYMSPEQAQGEAHSADRRSDVYSLGVILFQLLTRELPFRGNARMLIKQVVHDEPPSPRKLNSSVARDLETITLKCLEKEPGRRYQTARGLAEELKRFLTGEPIHARPIGGLERAWRWSKRNSTAAILMLTVAASLTAGVIVSSYFAASASREAAAATSALRQAEAERQRVERVNKFFMDEVFGLADPTSFDRAGISLVEALDIAASKVDERFADDQELRVGIQDRLAEIYNAIDEPTKALVHAEKAVATREKWRGPMDPLTLKSRVNLAMVFYRLGRFQKAKGLLERALADQSKVIGPGHSDSMRTAIHLGLVLMNMGDEQALQTAESTYQNALKTFGPRDPMTFDAQSSYAWTIRWLGQGQKALPVAKAAALGLREVSGEDDLRTMYADYNYAVCLAQVGRIQEAADEFKKLLDTRRRVLGPAHVDTIFTAWRFAAYARQAGDKAAALVVLDDVWANLDSIQATDNLRRAEPLMTFAESMEGLGQEKKVADIQAAALKMYQGAMKKGVHVQNATFLNSLAWALANSSIAKFRDGKLAVELATKACEMAKYQNASMVNTLAAAYAQTGDFESAVKWSEKSLEILGGSDPAKRAQFSAALEKYKAKKPMRTGQPAESTQPSTDELKSKSESAGATGGESLGVKN